MINVSTDEFRAMLADPDPDIRWQARMLVLLPEAGYLAGATEAQDEIRDMLADPDPVVRERAQGARRTQLRGRLLDHVVVVLQVLADDTAVDAWPDCAELLRAFVPTREFNFLVTALARMESEGLGNRLANYPTLDGGGEREDRRARAADALDRCFQLSHRFGTAHWYAQCVDGYDDHSGWCVYEDGELLRYCYYHPVYFDLPAGEVLVGPTSLAGLVTASPAEDLRAWLAKHGEPFEPGDGEWPDPSRDWEFSVSRVAGQLSVNPESFGPDTRVSGTGVLAMPRALRDRPRYGALPV